MSTQETPTIVVSNSAYMSGRASATTEASANARATATSSAAARHGWGNAADGDVSARVSSVVAMGPVPLDERVGRRIVLRRIGDRQLRRDPVGQRLAQLHAPLVEAVDAPHGALHEHDVLVQ